MARIRSNKELRASILTEIKLRNKKTPLEFLLEVMWNPRRTLEIRIEAAKAAAPYVHKKMPVDLQIDVNDIRPIPPFLPSRQELMEEDLEFIEHEEQHV